MTEIRWAESKCHLQIEAFRPNPRNPKKHTRTQLSHIRESILQFGFLDPIGEWGDENIVAFLQKKWGKRIVKNDVTDKSHKAVKLKTQIDFNPIIHIPIRGV